MKKREIISRVYVPLVLFIAGLFCLSIGAFLIPDWHTIPIETLFQEGMITIVLTCIFIILTIISAVLMLRPRKPQRENVAYDDHSDLNGKESINGKIMIPLIIIGIFTNFFSIAAVFFRDSQFFSDWLLVFDIVEVVGIILNLVIIRLFSKIYSTDFRKNNVFQNSLLIINNLMLLLFILTYGGVMLILLVEGGIFPANIEFITFLKDLRRIISVSFHVLVVLTLSSAALNIEHYIDDIRASNEKRSLRFGSNHVLSLIVRSSRLLIKMILSLLFFVGIIVSVYILVGDFIMFFNYFAVPFTVAVLVPIIIWLIRYIEEDTADEEEMERHITLNRFKAFAALMIIVNLLPVSITPVYPTISLDAQFSTVFGPNWDSGFTEEERAFLKDSKYSFYKNIYPDDIDINVEYNIKYTEDFPYSITGNTTTVKHSFYFDAYLPSWRQFGTESTPGLDPLPVIIMMHGEVEDKGPWNANLTSQILANKGYLVCDMNYGYITHNEHGENNNGYLLIQVVEQIADFTKELYLNRSYFHADMNNTYFAGRHLGGGLALICGHGYNSTLSGMFEPNMNVKGVIGFYPISDIGCVNCMFYQVKSDPENDEDYPYMNGSSNPADANYDLNWVLLNPTDIVDNSNSPPGSRAPTLIFCGTHDYMIPYAHNQNFVHTLMENGHDIICGYYFLGSDGFDGAFNSHYGQNVMYYLERFLLLA